MHFQATALSFVGDSVGQRWRRTDLRLGKRFRIGASAVETALVMQNLGPAYPDLATSGEILRFRHRAFVTVAVDL